MKSNVIVRDEKYRGKFVALRSFVDRTVVAADKDPDEAARKAKAKGVETPVMMFLPKKKMTCLY